MLLKLIKCIKKCKSFCGKNIFSSTDTDLQIMKNRFIIIAIFSFLSIYTCKTYEGLRKGFLNLFICKDHSRYDHIGYNNCNMQTNCNYTAIRSQEVPEYYPIKL